MKYKPWVQTAIALGLLGVAGAQFLESCQGTRIDLNPYLALGTVAAEEAAGLVGGKGNIVVVVTDTGRDRDPVLDAQLAAFKTSLKAHRGVQIKAIEQVTMDPFLSMQTGGAMPPDQYVAVRRKHADAAGIVLFIPFPPLSDAEVESVGTGLTKVMVVSPPLLTYRELIRKGAIDLAIVSRTVSADQATSKTGSLREAFDRENEIWRRESGAVP